MKQLSEFKKRIGERVEKVVVETFERQEQEKEIERLLKMRMEKKEERLEPRVGWKQRHGAEIKFEW